SLLVFFWLARCAAGRSMLTARGAAALGAILIAGATCFGTGIVTAMASPLLVLLLVPRSQRTPAAVRWLSAVPLVVMAIYLACSREAASPAMGAMVFPLAFGTVALRMLAGMATFGAAHVFWAPPLPHDVAMSAPVMEGVAASVGALLIASMWSGGRT